MKIKIPHASMGGTNFVNIFYDNKNFTHFFLFKKVQLKSYYFDLIIIRKHFRYANGKCIRNFKKSFVSMALKITLSTK